MAWLEKRRGKWVICWRTESGRRRRKVAYTDKAASRQKLAELERNLARGEAGLVDQYATHRRRPIEDHLTDYLSELRTAGRSPKYVRTIGYRVRKLLAACGWKYLRDVTADSFCGWRDAIPCGKDGRPVIGPVTQNQHHEAAAAFCRWCVKRGRMPTLPLAGLAKADESIDIRRERRALSPEQVAGLLDAVDAGYRAVYRFMLATGLRRRETRLLCWGDLALNSPTPFIRLRAETTKAKRADSLPLHPVIAAELRELRGDAADGDRVFARVPTMHRHRKYLEAAEIPFEDEDGRRADVHALRHTFGTMLSMSGASPRVAMELMRHTDLKLTMKHYTDPRIFDLASSVARVPIPAATPAVDKKAPKTATG